MKSLLAVAVLFLAGCTFLEPTPELTPTPVTLLPTPVTLLPGEATDLVKSWLAQRVWREPHTEYRTDLIRTEGFKLSYPGGSMLESGGRLPVLEPETQYKTTQSPYSVYTTADCLSYHDRRNAVWLEGQQALTAWFSGTNTPTPPTVIYVPIKDQGQIIGYREELLPTLTPAPIPTPMPVAPSVNAIFVVHGYWAWEVDPISRVVTPLAKPPVQPC